MRCIWLLEEVGAEYESHPLDFQKKEHKAPEYLKLNPNGKVPCLVDGDVVEAEAFQHFGHRVEARAVQWRVDDLEIFAAVVVQRKRFDFREVGFVELGAEINVASTAVPVRSIRPLCCSSSLTTRSMSTARS